MQDRLDRMPDAMRVQRRIIEHVFGTIKDWMGRSHFKTKTLGKVSTEMSPHVLAYNITCPRWAITVVVRRGFDVGSFRGTVSGRTRKLLRRSGTEKHAE